MVRDDYELGDSLNVVATHDYFPDTRSEINSVDSAMTINYDEVVSNKVGDDDVQ